MYHVFHRVPSMVRAFVEFISNHESVFCFRWSERCSYESLNIYAAISKAGAGQLDLLILDTNIPFKVISFSLIKNFCFLYSRKTFVADHLFDNREDYNPHTFVFLRLICFNVFFLHFSKWCVFHYSELYVFQYSCSLGSWDLKETLSKESAFDGYDTRIRSPWIQWDTCRMVS